MYQIVLYSSTDAPVSCLKNNIKIYIKFYIKTAPCETIEAQQASLLNSYKKPKLKLPKRCFNVNFNIFSKTTHWCISW